MGASLPTVVDSTVVERHEGKNFRTAVAEMNGWRTNMEDSHLAFFGDDWGFFGVFDGHGGDACALFVAPRIRRELEENGCPADDAAVKKMLFAIDQEFLDKEVASGSTATMCIVHKPKNKGDKHKLRLINAGDSRVLLGKRDGSIVDGGGTDEGLSTDHKPDHPVERERIYRCGGHVEHNEGNCARVNGDLAVSRGFGDREYKKTGGPDPQDRPVTIDPELKEFECDEADFLMLVCDGVSEGNFSNAEAVAMVAKHLKESDDPGAAAKAICHKAVEMDSKDNISCLVVLFDGVEKDRTETEFLPGSVAKLGNSSYNKCYTAMAEKAGFNLAQAAELRYDLLQASEEERRKLQVPGGGPGCPGTVDPDEVAKLGEPAGEKGSDERRKWFDHWIENVPEDKDGGGPGGMGGMGGMDLQSLMGGKGKGGKGDILNALGKGGGGKGSKDSFQPPEREEQKAPTECIEKDEDGYAWSQNGDEIQITFSLEKSATKKDVKVGFKTKTLDVAVSGESLLKGALAGEVDVEECTWCLVNGGSELQVMLTKMKAKDEWKALVN